MFFPEKITLPRPGWKVLEIGPGISPHSRADEFLELRYEDESAKLRQRGGEQGDTTCFGNRPIHLYDGDKFPFQDNEFDYVICSHVIEHVPDPEGFMSEIFRVGSGRGYLEYPLLPYEYLFDFDVHINIVKYRESAGALNFARKTDLFGPALKPVRDLFRSSLEKGWNELVDNNKRVFFEGFEFGTPFSVSYAPILDLYLDSGMEFKQQKPIRKIAHKIMRKLRV